MAEISSLNAAPRRHRTYLGDVRVRFLANNVAIGALVVFVAVALFSFGSPLISTLVTQQTYEAQDLANAYTGPGAVTVARRYVSGEFVEERSYHWLGTDELGRDVLTRLSYGGRISLSVAFLALLIALTIGIVVGAASGYYGAWLDAILMRLVDAILAIPSLFVLMLVAAMVNNSRFLATNDLYREAGWLVLPVVIAALGWTSLARLVRGQFLSIRSREFVEAARCVGARDRRIIGLHILPAVVPIVVTWSGLVLPGLILTEAALSYLGFGVQVPTPSWGNMLTQATEYYTRAPHLLLLPGLMIFITVLSLNLLANALRDALDPLIGAT